MASTEATTTSRNRHRGPGAGEPPPRREDATSPASLLWSVKRTAEALSISVRLLYSLTQAGELPAVRIGRMVRYRVADVEAFVNRHGVKGGPG
ncbi:MAG: helix-turn-helix domain-containing protein [Phycisphaerae bacterium]|nr:helix-turn-helix domain-containing protein [Phycisphaerae bacterium]